MRRILSGIFDGFLVVMVLIVLLNYIVNYLDINIISTSITSKDFILIEIQKGIEKDNIYVFKSNKSNEVLNITDTINKFNIGDTLKFTNK